ncbi:MAG TPA: exodeoxyribonuclease VII large subunit [Thermoanaerobaculia bacterium]
MSDRHVYTVTELIHEINRTLYSYRDISVEGEVSNFTRSAAGHLYFSIKDATSQLRIVMFATQARMLRFRIENGLKLVIRGRLNVYEAKGELQVNATAAEPVGLGALQLAFEQLKTRLAAEGLFDAARKKPIPMLPRRIAIVTSPTGAAIRDILNVLRRRFDGLAIQIYPVRVQGAGAANEIATALRSLSRWEIHDVVILARGGGSLEDLWAFNEEVVARAIAASMIPVISAVGHEVDFTISDFVADLRAPTPSAAAEIVISAKAEISDRVDNSVRRIHNVIDRSLRHYRTELRHLSSADGIGLVPRRIALVRDRLERQRGSLARMLERQASALRLRLHRCEAPLARLLPARIARDRHKLQGLVATLQAVSPLSVLSRGYAIALAHRGGRKRPVLDSMAVQIGEAIEVQLKKGRLNCTVDGRTLGLESVLPKLTEEE